MNFLLDTHAFLWWINDDSRLSPAARVIMSSRENELFLSAASGWEMIIKSQIGRLLLPGDPAGFISRQLSLNEIRALPIMMSHALHYHTLPLLHRDPFDRMIVAQSQIENLSILSADPMISHYDVKVVW